MATVELPYLWMRPARNGKRIAYYRRDGVYHRITAPDGRSLLPGQAGFNDAYECLHRAAEDRQQSHPSSAQSKPHSLAELIGQYRVSTEFRQLASSTQADYGRILDSLETAFGGKLVPGMPRAAVFTVRDYFAVGEDGKPTPRRGNKAIAVLSALLTWGMNHTTWVKENVALHPGKPLKTGDGYLSWTWAELEQFLADERIRLDLRIAVAAVAYIGARVSEIIIIQKTGRKDGWITYKPGKTSKTTGATANVPEHPVLTAWLDKLPANDAPTLLVRDDGQPWGLDHIKHALADAVALLGMRPGLSFHGVRKALHAGLADVGASDAQIEAIIPHADPKMTRHYRAQADQKKLAKAGIARLPGWVAEVGSDTHLAGD
jgi:integrase